MKLSSGQQAIRRILFGADPDQYMLNYRARQLLALVHASPLVEYVTKLDPRITYRFDTADLFAEQIYTPQVTNLTGDAGLRIVGEAAAPDITGRMRYSLRLTLTDGDTIQIRQSYPPAQKTTDLTFSGGVSNRVRLGDTGYDVRIDDMAGSGDEWLVECLNRPQWDLSQLVANLSHVGETALLDVFGLSKAEPYATFRNLWYRNRELPLQLGGLVMALIYSTEARRG